MALETLSGLQAELDFDVEKIFIDGDADLEREYGEQVPVIKIDGKQHDFFRVDPDRFRVSLQKHRQHQ